MNKFKPAIIIFFLLLCTTKVSLSQKSIHIYGYIKDIKTDEALPGATVYDEVSQKGVISDYSGYFNIKVNNPTKLRISFVGYTDHYVGIDQKNDSLVYILLESANLLEEVVVTDNKQISGNVAGLSQKELNLIPALGGKPDVAKALQLLPGINTQSEASSLLIVRGGDPGQNLYLFDNVPIIYVNHLGGFMSVFNPEVINNIDVFKGAFPARYGGKLSSVIDIAQKKGDISGLKGNYSLGLTDLSFCVEGPGKISNSSFIVAGRKTLIDPLMYLFSSASQANDFSVAYGFHDLNGKYTWNPNTKNSFNINLYYGDDYLKYWQNNNNEKNKHSNVWGNMMASGHWKNTISASLYANTIISYSRYRLKDKYRYVLTEDQGQTRNYDKYYSSVSDISVHSSLKHFPSRFVANQYGIKYSLYTFLPFYHISSNTNKEVGANNLSNEIACYANSKISFLDYSHIEAGIRGVRFVSGTFNDYSFEPRFNINIGINKQHSINASYMSTKQYNHLLLTTGSIMLNEIWIPASKQIPPSVVDQFTLGYNWSFNGFQLQTDLFYKGMDNLATYRDGYSAFEGDINWESKVEASGTGMAKGIELLIKKTKGKITGFASYTLSKAERQYANINSGKKHLFDFDRTHSFSVYFYYLIKENLNLNITWIYQTGLPYTPALGKIYSPTTEESETYYYENLIYGERNSARLRDYHRLDVGLNYETITKNGRKAIWSFSVYNLYNRQNPYFYYYNTNNTGEIRFPDAGNETLPLKLYQMSFFPIIPTASYKVFFEKGQGPTRKRKGALKKWLYQI